MGKLIDKESIRWGAAFVVALIILVSIINPLLIDYTGKDELKDSTIWAAAFVGALLVIIALINPLLTHVKGKKVIREVRNKESVKWVIAFLVGFLILYVLLNPILMQLTGSEIPIVTVMSDSMEHDVSFDDWWKKNQQLYLGKSIIKEDFELFPFLDGINVGDIVLVVDKDPEYIKVGDVIVFENKAGEMIIHRVIDRWTEIGDSGDVKNFFWTKGDNHYISIRSRLFNESRISEDDVRGVATFRIKYLGLPRVILKI